MSTSTQTTGFTMTLSTGRTIRVENGVNEYFYKVVDGAYESGLFNSLEEAQADARDCEADENHSGRVAIIRFEIGDAGSGVVIESRGDEYRLSIDSIYASAEMASLCDEANDEHNRLNPAD